jgi:hypothetical protein
VLYVITKARSHNPLIPGSNPGGPTQKAVANAAFLLEEAGGSRLTRMDSPLIVRRWPAESAVWRLSEIRTLKPLRRPVGRELGDRDPAFHVHSASLSPKSASGVSSVAHVAVGAPAGYCTTTDTAAFRAGRRIVVDVTPATTCPTFTTAPGLPMLVLPPQSLSGSESRDPPSVGLPSPRLAAD